VLLRLLLLLLLLLLLVSGGATTALVRPACRRTGASTPACSDVWRMGGIAREGLKDLTLGLTLGLSLGLSCRV